MKTLVFGFFVAMIVSFVSTAFYLGYYKDVKFEISETENFHFLFVKNTGPYHDINKQIERVETWAKEQKISCPRSYGKYLDDPKEVDNEKLRSEVGCVLEGTLSQDIQLPEGFYQESYPARKALIASFEGSPALGPLKVYPDATDWFEKNQLPLDYVIEVYSIYQEKEFFTQYIFPIPLDKLGEGEIPLSL